MYRIERLTVLDDSGLADLQRLYGEYDPKTAPTASSMRDAAVQNVFLVARESGSGRIVGFLTIVFYPRMKGTVAQVEDVFVEQARRRTGAGRLLMERALMLARDAKCVDLHLSTYPDMDAANAFYDEVGGTYRIMHVYKWLLN